jgi:parvulin-like peptidyl-prolyl isomerase
MRPTGQGEKAWMESLKGRVTTDASFRQVAKDTSEGEAAEDGGDIGWIAMGELEDQLDTAIYTTAVGALSAVIEVTGSGTYLFRILAEETREPTEEQLQIFEDSGFSYWYTGQKENATIDYALGTAADA